MNKINFNNNEFTTLSTEVIEAMKSAIEEFADANPIGFGNDYRVEAETEEIKSSISERLKAESYHLYFTNGLPQSEIELINLSVLQLNVELIITTVFETTDKLNYLKYLEEAGKIELHILKTSEFGEIDLEDLKSILEANKSIALISLSHANRFTGVLLPVKDISNMAKQSNAFFHLDSTQMIGKYEN
jgi:cysteine desulfurase